MSTLSADVEKILADAKRGECVRCSKPAVASVTVMLADATGQPNGDVRELELCEWCCVELLAQPSTRLIPFGEA